MGSQWRDFQLKGNMFKQMNSCKDVTGYINREYVLERTQLCEPICRKFEWSPNFIKNILLIPHRRYLYHKKSFSWWDNGLGNIF